MKKNLLSIVILALLIVNLVMTSIMMISVTGTNKKTAAIVTDIASILKLELNPEGESETPAEVVSLEDTQVYDLPEEMTILLAKGEDGTQHFAMVKVSLSLNTKNDGYKTYGADIGTRQSLIESIITEVIGKYTADEIQPRSADIQKEILERLQSKEMFDSDFIYKVTFSKLIVQ